MSCISYFMFVEVLQRKVCPSVTDYQPFRLCLNPVHDCTGDADCKLGQRCCPPEMGCDNTCRETVPPLGCPIPIDLAFVLDSSGSIGRRNWIKVKKFVNGIIDYYDVSERGTHVGIIMYSNNASVQLKFNKYKGPDMNNVNTKREVDNLILEKGLTFIDKGVLLAAKELFVEENGMRPKRKKVALVITDGQQTKDRGAFMALDKATAPLKAKDVYVYALGIGVGVVHSELLAIGSGPAYVYSATNFNELQTRVREITKAQCQACASQADVVFGIPDAIDLGPEEFKNIKTFFTKLSGLFQIDAKTAHVGLIRYSDDADIIVKLDEKQNSESSEESIQTLILRGTGINVKRALDIASDNAFTIFGGLRQTAPKTYIMFVPGGVKMEPAIQTAASKLKAMGVRIVILGITGKIDEAFSTAASKPPARYFLSAVDFDALAVAAYEAAGTACKAKYGKCQVTAAAPVAKPAECPAEVVNVCDVDGDCNNREEVCCTGTCGRICQARVKNCFISMDVAIVIDTASDVSDEDFQQAKQFTTSFIHSLAYAENAIRFGLMEYAEQTNTLTQFHHITTEADLKSLVNNMKKSPGTNRRVDIALRTLKAQIFSLKGGIKQGHPRYAVFVTTGVTSPVSEDLRKASQELRNLGVNIIAVGINAGVDTVFLTQLASETKFVFSYQSSSELKTLWDRLKQMMCNPKPGSCPALKKKTCTAKPEIAANQIPCGETAGHMGLTAKENDWECPGELKCCQDPLGCLWLCSKSQGNVCEGQHDLALVIESSEKTGFKKIKQFAKEIVESFTISQAKTLVSVITYGGSAKVNFQFNSPTGSSLTKIKNAIDDLLLIGGGIAGSGEALQLAHDNVFTSGGGWREKSNKSIVIINQGRFHDNALVISTASKLRQKLVDVFAVPIGLNADVKTLSKVVNKPVEKNVFMTTSMNALKSNLRALTNTICEGAIKIKICQQPLDIVLGIPVSSSLGASFKDIKSFFNEIIGLLRINKMQVHVGVETYSDNAKFPLHIDSTYNRKNIMNFVNRLKASGKKINVEEAFNVATHSAFSIFGGVRQTSPKVYIVLVPEGASIAEKAIRDAATILKDLGVRVFVMGLDGMDKSLAKGIVSQPSQKYLYTAKSYGELAARIPDIVDAVCKGRYGKCPLLPPIEPTCPNSPPSECGYDRDCTTEGDMCCLDKCGAAKCSKGTKNCFVTMDVAIAIDTSSDVSDEDLKQAKLFIASFIHSLAGAENAIRFGIMQYAAQANTLTNFYQLTTETNLKSLLDGMKKSPATNKRVDIALRTLKAQLFSLEGGMRQGHPRYAVFLAAGATSPDSKDLTKASQDLRNLGVSIIAVGVNAGVDTIFLGQLATEKKFVFSSQSSSELQTLGAKLKQLMCNPKPGQCSVPKAPCITRPFVGPNQIPCGQTVGKKGRTAKVNDWDCPGEQKCCLDATGCLSICQHPPNFCRGRYDLALLIESTSTIGENGLTKNKQFAKQLVEAFTISQENTHVSLVTFGASATGNLWFNSLAGPSLDVKAVKKAIDGIGLSGGNVASTNAALQLALDNVFTESGGSRDNANKSLVIFSQGSFQDNAQAISIASKLRQKFVDVFAVPIGLNADIQTLSKVVNRPIEKNIFITSSFNALKPNLRVLTKTICEGALKIRICDEPLDIVLGIPVADSLSSTFPSIKAVFNGIVSLLKVNKMQIHIGVQTYSNIAEFPLHIDSTYNRNHIINYINRIPIRGNGMNLENAFNIASNRAFTIYGGVRQTSPKVYIILVPGRVGGSEEKIRASARKLKGLGVKVFVLGIESLIDKEIAKAIASKPTQKYLYTTNSYGELAGIAYKIVDVICRGRYGKCPPPTPPGPSCPDAPPKECSFDKDCATKSQMCCVDGCGSAKCARAVKNCYVPSEIAFALDVSETTTKDDFDNMKMIVKRIIAPLASSENNLHLGVITYASTPNIITRGFRNFRSEEELIGLLDSLTKTTETGTRVDLALRAAKRELFSPKGRMRHGHPKYLIFLASTAQTNGNSDLKLASSDLREAGVNVLAVGMTTAVDGQFLQSLASDGSFVFTGATADNLEKVISDVSAKLCHEKPGKCPVVSNLDPTACASKPPVPAALIPCGRSVGKEGQSNSENDWDCPGETKCCLEPTNGCHSVCVPPPLVCKKKKDLLFMVEATDQIGRFGFKKITNFIKQIVNAFDISPSDTHVGFMSVYKRSTVNFGFRRGSRSKSKVMEEIDRVKFSKGRSVNIYKGFETADDIIFGRNQGREKVNKSVVLFSSGMFTDPYQAKKTSFTLKEQQVDIFAVAIGRNSEVEYLENVVSRKPDKNIFMMSSFGALKPQLRALVHTICEGAIKEVSVRRSLK